MPRQYLTAVAVCLGSLVTILEPGLASAQTFTNPSAISIPSVGVATPYPSNITVSGLSGPIQRVTITLNGLTHTFTDDLDMLLVAPDGARLVVFSDAGGINAISGVNITLDDKAAAQIPDSAALTSGGFRPGNFLTVVDPFPVPAPTFTSTDSPAPGGVATFASQFSGHNGNGTWSLYVVDDASGDLGTIAGGWSITFSTPPPAGALLISEFRVRGPNGATDEFIEITNVSGVDHVVSPTSGTGYGVAASDGVTRCSIPSGTNIANGGHYLCANSVGYSLTAYAAGNGLYTTDIADNAGIAFFNNNTGGGSYTLANRLDAAGSTSEANTLYREGAGYPALVPFSVDYAWVRRTPGGCTGSGGGMSGDCDSTGLIAGTPASPTAVPLDSNDNANDFLFLDTNATSANAGQRLGAPGPQNFSAPIYRPDGTGLAALDSCSALNAPPNFVRDFTSDPASNSTFGTVDLRRRFTNVSGGNITRLRFRVIDITTFPSLSGVADLRPRTSPDLVVTVDRPPCSTGTGGVT